MTKRKPTIGQQIDALRAAKSRQLHAEYAKQEPRLARKISPDQMYSQGDLAEDAGCTQSQISDWINGHKQPRIDSLRRLATALDVPLAELIGE